ncbi:MAG: VapE domain-containing protein [Bacteroidota bacterium]
MEYKFSLYESKEGHSASDLSLDNYIGMIKHGANQDLVIQGRLLKGQGKKKEYSDLKAKSKVIMGSAVFESGKSKHVSNIKALNNLIVIDIDTEVSDEQYHELKNDKYTFVIHRSFGGDGFCIFVKIDSNRFEDTFYGLADYYYNTYNISIDQSCKNKNRLRFLSYDPDVYQNDKANKFNPKNVKKFTAPKPDATNYVFHHDDFDNIFRQITERSIDLVQGDYFRYIRIGFALFDKLGAAGERYFQIINQYNPNLNKKNEAKEWKALCKPGGVGIGTFYYYCKEAGIDIYTEKTKTIINRVKVAKSQGTPTVDSVVSNLRVANNITASERDIQLINFLITSKNDYSKEANIELTEIEQVQKFIIDTYTPFYDEISKYVYVKDKVMEEKELNDIYLNCKKSFDFKIPVSDILSILYSSAIPTRNMLKEFIKNNHYDPTGFIDAYASFIHPQTEYNKWAFKKWIVGAMHNWLCDSGSRIVSPLTLVLTGQQHGTGKTSFFRNALPDELSEYMIEEKIESKDKDSVFRMCKSLFMFDDEFGGDGFKDVKAFKRVTDITRVTQRRPFAKQDSIFRRIAALCGSSNENDILKDITGNRRILPINVQIIDYYDMIASDRKALIIEAYNLYKSGFNWVIRTQEEIDYIKANTQQNEIVLPIEEIFFNHFSIESSVNFPKEIVVNQGEILEYLSLNSILKPTKYEIKEVLTKNKMVYQTFRINGEFKKGIRLFTKWQNDEVKPPF